MSGQMNMDELFRDAISAPGEPHLACVLLLDVSGSMAGDRIDNLNQALIRFKEQVCRDEIARKRVDVAVVTFGNEARVLSDFVPIEQFQPVQLFAQGRTSMAEGINLAIDLVKNRNRFYHSMGVPCFKPWIFMITDGLSTSTQQDMYDVSMRIKQEENAGSVGKLKFWALGIGQYDVKQMFMLTRRVIELKEHNFTGIFDWLSDSMTAISQSQVGENIRLGMLPEDARKANPDRMIDEDW